MRDVLIAWAPWFFYIGCMVFLIYSAILNDSAESKRLYETTGQEDRRLQRQVDYMNDMLFYKDQTTGLCFASTGVHTTRTMTNVDCAALKYTISFWSK